MQATPTLDPTTTSNPTPTPGPRRLARTGRPTAVYYRFEVTDPRTGETYGITLSDEGQPVVSAPCAAEFDQCFDVAWGGPEDSPKLVAKTSR